MILKNKHIKNKNQRKRKITIHNHIKHNDNKYITIMLILFIILILIFVWNFMLNKKINKTITIDNQDSSLTSSKNEIYEENKINNITSINNYKNKINFSNINRNEMNDYIKLCNNGNLISKIPKFVDNPKITVVIPVYNAHKYLKKTIRSIQNQNMEEIEILIVDDFSTDNTIEVVKELQEEDCRIKLIKNKENRGTLYTRSIGALNAKGKYIMPIDNDDLFMPGIFNISYEEAENNNIDIIEFSGCDVV